MHIVTDKHIEFSNNNEIISSSELINLLSDDNSIIPENTTLISGQGISKKQSKEITETIENSQFKDNITYIDQNDNAIDKKYVHKYKDENVLISEPYKTEKDTFASSLLMGDSCAETSDHTTGQHIQGMVLIEAARQMFIGVTETFFKPNKDINYYYIFNDIKTTFTAFAFPIPVNIIYRIEEQKISSSGNMDFKVSIDFYQNGTIVTTTEIEFSAYIATIAKRIEAKKAKHAITSANHIINNYMNSNNLTAI